jgi:hypothetical protein
MAEFTWPRERAILNYLIEREEHGDDLFQLRAEQIAEVVGEQPKTVALGMRRLLRAGYIDGKEAKSFGPDFQVFAEAITDAGLRAAGAWPSSEPDFETLLAQLKELAEQAPEDQRPKWRKAVDGLAAAGRDVGVEVAAAIATRSMGVG